MLFNVNWFPLFYSYLFNRFYSLKVMASGSTRRILVETKNLSKDPPPGISATPDDNNCRLVV